MTINEMLDQYIDAKVQNYRTVICRVVEKNDDNTFDCEPIDGDTIILNSRTYESAVGLISPTIDSIVSVNFYDDQTSYITNIVEYDQYTVLSQDTTLVGNNTYSVISNNIDNISVSRNDVPDITTDSIDNIKQSIKVERENLINDNPQLGWSTFDTENAGSINNYATNILNSATIIANVADEFIFNQSKRIIDKSTFRTIESTTEFDIESNRISNKADGSISLLSNRVNVNQGDLISYLSNLTNAITQLNTAVQVLAPNPALVQTITQLNLDLIQIKTYIP